MFRRLIAKYHEHRDEFYFDVQVVPTNWIAGAIKNPGALRAKAEAAGALTNRGTIRVSWLRHMAASGDPETARQARLALTLRSMRAGR